MSTHAEVPASAEARRATPALADLAGRIGDRDDSSRFSDRSLSAERVLGTPQAVPVEEADEVPPPDDKPQKAGPERMPQPPQKVPVEQVTFQVPQKEPKKGDAVDWYVDVDFPPIVVKDIKPYFDSLKVLKEMLPPGPESDKLAVSLALSAPGINDVDQLVVNLYPLLPPGAKPTQMLTAGQQAPQLGLPEGGMKMLGAGPMRESVSPLRVHRFLTAVQAATVEAAS